MTSPTPTPAALRRFRFDRATLGSDLAAGLTVGAMLVPQGMAYALLAGLPPEVGLYASIVPLVLYAIFGTSRQLAVGPVAIVSLLSATTLATVADEGTAGYVAAAGMLAVLVGVIHLVLGFGRLGFLTRLLSHPVLVGFTSAAALIIGASQVKHLMGVKLEKDEHFHDVVWGLVSQVTEAHGLTVLVGLGAIALMFGLKRWLPVVPGALAAVAVTTVASVVWDLESRGVKVVGDIPQGLPPLTVPDDFGIIGTLLPAAAIITLVGFMESIAVAKVYARRNRYEVDPNRELIGLGVANVGAGLFGGYPVTGGFSRTAVNAEAGAKTKLAAVITAGIVLLVIVALTPLFKQLPSATLGAIVVVAVAKLFDFAEIKHIKKLKTADFLTLVVAFVATLAFGVELGIGIAVAASIVVVAVRMMTPHTAELGRLPGTTLYRNIQRFAEAERVPGVEIIRFDVSLSYLNVEFLKRRVHRLVDHAEGEVRAVVLDATGVNDIDTSATEALTELIQELDEQGCAVHLATVKGPVRDVLMRAGLYQSLGDRVHNEVHDAVLAATSAKGSDQTAR
ncbi:MAG TPA: solute carrier family 26 protein [Acidimicrobiales bacterium]|nr:solute carrier family 26 protein [Acidimicrobiales bacterium]